MKIHFIGVWDTVDAVGKPFHISDIINSVFYRFKFPDRTLSEHVEHAYHALAVDEERHSFDPLLWKQSIPSQNKTQKVEQVWFAGAHSNVGGGYPKQGMSLVALDWLMERLNQPASVSSPMTAITTMSMGTSTTSCTTRAPGWGCSTDGSLATSW